MLIPTLALLLFAAYPAIACDNSLPQKPIEGRAIWIDARSIPKDDKSMEALVESFAKANLNILMPEVVRRGYTLYPSKLDEQDPAWSGYDPLAALIREAHKRGMEVHPWVWVFRQGYTLNKGPILTAHPDWIAMNKWGETLSVNGGYWVCPCNPEARGYLSSLFKEIITDYDVDGLHLDYIRFENQFPAPYCYNDCCRSAFKEKYEVDPMDIDPLSEMQVNWHLWREGLINSFVRRIAKEVRAIKPNVKLSAAVGAMPDRARIDLLQDWPNWVANEWIDFVTPMSYTGSIDTFKDMVSAEKTAVNNRTILMPGLGLHTHADSGVTLEELQAAREMGTDGVAIFAAAYFNESLQKALIAGPFATKAEIPFRVKAPAYGKTNHGYIAPTRPPVFIPETILPIPNVDVTRTATSPVIDGLLDEPMWSQAAQIDIAHTNMGDPAPATTNIRLAYDDTNLYIGYTAQEPNMAALKETVTTRDGPVFYDDSAEFFLDPSSKRQKYSHFALNLLGTQYDSMIMDSSISFKWQSAMSKGEGRWTAEIAIPFESLGASTPRSGESWTANFGRNRWACGEPAYLIWSVTYGGFHRPERFGVITFK